MGKVIPCIWHFYTINRVGLKSGCGKQYVGLFIFICRYAYLDLSFSLEFLADLYTFFTFHDRETYVLRPWNVKILLR